jgi:hypothetical protein
MANTLINVFGLTVSVNYGDRDACFFKYFRTKFVPVFRIANRAGAEMRNVFSALLQKIKLFAEIGEHG